MFDAVNENLPEIIESFGSDTRKIFANEYIDDRNTWPQKNDVADILYLCDGKSCGDTCPGTLGTGCKHTSDISHAKNFAKGIYDSYWEKEAESESQDSGSHEKSSMELWAEREVEIACKREAPDQKPGEWDLSLIHIISIKTRNVVESEANKAFWVSEWNGFLRERK